MAKTRVIIRKHYNYDYYHIMFADKFDKNGQRYYVCDALGFPRVYKTEASAKRHAEKHGFEVVED